MTDISKKVAEQIKKGQVTPKPWWYFLLNKSVVWIIVAVGTTLGMIAFGLILFQIDNTDWDLHTKLTESRIEFVVETLPYLWLMILAGSAWLAVHYFRKVEGGYRHSALIVVMASILISMIGGTVLHARGMTDRIEEELERKVPYYERLQHRNRTWMSPEKGLLMGRVRMMTNDGGIEIEDLQDRRWMIDMRDMRPEIPTNIREGMKLKLMGEMMNGTGFKAHEMRPEKGGERFFGEVKEKMGDLRTSE